MKSKVEISFKILKVVEIIHNDDENAIEAYNNDPDGFQWKNVKDLKELNTLLSPIAKAGWEIEDDYQEIQEDTLSQDNNKEAE